jgi:hypothetical protein
LNDIAALIFKKTLTAQSGELLGIGPAVNPRWAAQAERICAGAENTRAELQLAMLADLNIAHAIGMLNIQLHA